MGRLEIPPDYAQAQTQVHVHGAHPLYFGALLAGQLYLAGCFVAGLILHEPLAWKAALAGCATVYGNCLTYLMPSLASMRPAPAKIAHYAAAALFGFSLFFGALAGLPLLLR